jgi:hypothetical protein
VAIYSENTKIGFSSSSFYGNVARYGDGGAVFVSFGNQWDNFTGCLFEMNSAAGVGGGLGLNGGKDGRIDLCAFRNNSARTAGKIWC